ncbi:MAG: hypothetical protein ACOH2T_27245 [Pseudomonas sp.]
MWDQVKASSDDDKIKDALYASLFGLSDMDQVKMRLIQSAVPSIKANPELWAGAKKGAKAGVKGKRPVNTPSKSQH